MTITMDIAKTILRREYKGKVTQEEINEFMSSLTDTEFTQILAYAEACCDILK